MAPNRHNPEDRGWEQMHALLDREMPVKRSRRRLVPYWAGAAVAAGVLLLLLVTYTPPPTTPQPADSATSALAERVRTSPGFPSAAERAEAFLSVPPAAPSAEVERQFLPRPAERAPLPNGTDDEARRVLPGKTPLTRSSNTPGRAPEGRRTITTRPVSTNETITLPEPITASTPVDSTPVDSTPNVSALDRSEIAIGLPAPPADPASGSVLRSDALDAPGIELRTDAPLRSTFGRTHELSSAFSEQPIPVLAPPPPSVVAEITPTRARKSTFRATTELLAAPGGQFGGTLGAGLLRPLSATWTLRAGVRYRYHHLPQNLDLAENLDALELAATEPSLGQAYFYPTSGTFDVFSNADLSVQATELLRGGALVTDLHYLEFPVGIRRNLREFYVETALRPALLLAAVVDNTWSADGLFARGSQGVVFSNSGTVAESAVAADAVDFARPFQLSSDLRVGRRFGQRWSVDVGWQYALTPVDRGEVFPGRNAVSGFGSGNSGVDELHSRHQFSLGLNYRF